MLNVFLFLFLSIKFANLSFSLFMILWLYHVILCFTFTGLLQLKKNQYCSLTSILMNYFFILLQLLNIENAHFVQNANAKYKMLN